MEIWLKYTWRFEWFYIYTFCGDTITVQWQFVDINITIKHIFKHKKGHLQNFKNIQKKSCLFSTAEHDLHGKGVFATNGTHVCMVESRAVSGNTMSLKCTQDNIENATHLAADAKKMTIYFFDESKKSIRSHNIQTRAFQDLLVNRDNVTGMLITVGRLKKKKNNRDILKSTEVWWFDPRSDQVRDWKVDNLLAAAFHHLRERAGQLARCWYKETRWPGVGIKRLDGVSCLSAAKFFGVLAN